MCDPKNTLKSCCAHSCGCGDVPFVRRFVSNKEQQECLEKYREQLENEIVGIAERIQELKDR